MSVIIESIRLLSGGVPVGKNRGSDTLTTSDAVYSYGGDDWGLTLTGADVNSSSFGVVVSLSGLEATDTYSPAVSNYVKVTNFGFNIPSEDVISKITVFIEAKADAEGNASIDNIKIELTTSLSVDAIFSVNSDEIVLTSPIMSGSGSSNVLPSVGGINLTSVSTNILGKGLYNAIAQVLRFTNLSVNVAWDYLYISKSKNTTNWSEKSENSTTWTNQSKTSTDWKEL